MLVIKGEILRFLFVGVLNTLITYLTYLTLLNWLSYALAFSLSFALGLLIAFLLYSIFAFRAPPEWHKLPQYSFFYATHYLAGLATLFILVEHFKVDSRVAPLVSVMILTPISFLFNKWLLGSGR